MKSWRCPDNSVSMRYGGDEFVCVIPDYDQTQLQKLKQNLLDSLATLSRNSRMAFPIEASIGFVVADDSVFSLNDYINLADEKMYIDKKIVKPDGKIHIRLSVSDTHSLVTVVFEIFIDKRPKKEMAFSAWPVCSGVSETA